MYGAGMGQTTILDALRTWLDELADVEDQFLWLRDVTLEERPSSDPPEVLLLGESGDLDADELGKRVASEPTLGGAFDQATFRPANDAGAVGVFAVRPM